MKRWIRTISASTKFDTFTNEDWALYIAKKCNLGSDEMDDVLHDLNNLRADEVLELVEDKFTDPEFSAFCDQFHLYEDDDFDDEVIESNSQIGKYQGVDYGQEDDSPNRFYFVDKSGSVHYADTEEELFAKMDEILGCSKQDIRAWYIGEPSASDYGKAVDQAKKRIQDRFAPFKMTKTYFCRGRMNSTGYRITYKGQEWIADDGGKDSWSSNYGFKLYGPFTPGQIRSWGALFTHKPIDEFKSIDSVMSYLFSNVDVDDEDDYDDKKREIEDYIIKRNADVEKVNESANEITYMGPDGDTYDFDLDEIEYDLDDQLGGFSMWCIECGAVPPPGSHK